VVDINEGQRTGLSAEQIEAENRSAADLGAEDPRPHSQPPAQRNDDTPADEREPEASPNQSERFANKRGDIYARARENREALFTSDPELAEQIAESRRSRFGDAAEQPTQRQPDQPHQPAAPHQPAQPEAKRKLKVHGQEVELSQEEIDSAARQALAAGNLFDRAKAALAEANQILETAKGSGGNPAPDTPPAQPPAKPAQAQSAPILTDEQYAEIVDHIQVGNQKEGVTGLQKFGESIYERARADVLAALDERINERVPSLLDATERQKTARTALETFKEGTEYATSVPMQNALAHQTALEMRARLHEVGVQDEHLERIRQENNLSDLEAVASTYKRLRRDGFALPGDMAILTAADTELLKAQGKPPRVRQQAPAQQDAPSNPANNNNFDPQQRQALKREIAPQPRRASISPTVQNQERSREQSHADAVASMRAYRRGGR
jgi:hypothetical protein